VLLSFPFTAVCNFWEVVFRIIWSYWSCNLKQWGTRWLFVFWFFFYSHVYMIPAFTWTLSLGIILGQVIIQPITSLLTLLKGILLVITVSSIFINWLFFFLSYLALFCYTWNNFWYNMLFCFLCSLLLQCYSFVQLMKSGNCYLYTFVL